MRVLLGFSEEFLYERGSKTVKRTLLKWEVPSALIGGSRREHTTLWSNPSVPRQNSIIVIKMSKRVSIYAQVG